MSHFPTSHAQSTWACALSPRSGPEFSADGKSFELSIAALSSQVADLFFAPERIDRLKELPPLTVADSLLNEVNHQIHQQNADIQENRVHGTKRRPLARLGHQLLARTIAALHTVILLSPSNRNSDPDLDMLAVYDDDPTSETHGTYRASLEGLQMIARRYSPDMTTKEFTEVMAALRDGAPRRTRGTNRDLIAARNGIVDYSTLRVDESLPRDHPDHIITMPTFRPFSPDHVFLAKLDVDWNPQAPNPVIHNDADGTDWDVEAWMTSLSDDPEVVELLWQTIGATTRPYVSWGKAAFFFSTRGNNGKGTLLSLMRNMLGVANYASISLADFGKDFLLEPLTRASAILVDENDVGTFVERSSSFKAVVTNDVITINRKHRAPIAHQHFGFMVQCINDEPAIKDKSESFYRRQLFVPFDKCFTGAERKYIKDDYLKRPEVLEYVLRRVLTMRYYELSEPASVRMALERFKESNDPVRAFWNEFRNQLTWDLVPFQFLYDLYRSWLSRNMPHSKAVGRNKFTHAIVELNDADPGSQWECEDATAQHRPGARMNLPEMLIYEFELVDWCNRGASRSDPGRYSTVPADQLKSVYRGLMRRELVFGDPDDETSETEAAEASGPEVAQDSSTSPTAKHNGVNHDGNPYPPLQMFAPIDPNDLPRNGGPVPPESDDGPSDARRGDA